MTCGGLAIIASNGQASFHRSSSPRNCTRLPIVDGAIASLTCGARWNGRSNDCVAEKSRRNRHDASLTRQHGCRAGSTSMPSLSFTDRGTVQIAECVGVSPDPAFECIKDQRNQSGSGFSTWNEGRGLSHARAGLSRRDMVFPRPGDATNRRRPRNSSTESAVALLDRDRTDPHDGRFANALRTVELRCGSDMRGRVGDLRDVWRCPTSSILCEEAAAHIKDMHRPGVWRNPKCLNVRQAARADLESMRGRFKAEQKRRPGPKESFVATLKAGMSEDVRERWMKRRALVRSDRFTVAQKRELRKWFDALDRDGSGEIDSSELSHPLLSTGLARSALEVDRLVRQVDKDGSGEIGFKEFLAILQRGSADTSTYDLRGVRSSGDRSAVDKIVTLQEVKLAHGQDMEAVVALERRALLMKEKLDEAAYRDGVMADLTDKRYRAELHGDLRALKALSASELRLERRRARKNLFIQAVSDATNFERERARLEDAIMDGYRQELCRNHDAPSRNGIEASSGEETDDDL